MNMKQAEALLQRIDQFLCDKWEKDEYPIVTRREFTDGVIVTLLGIPLHNCDPDVVEEAEQLISKGLEISIPWLRRLRKFQKRNSFYYYEP